MPTYSPIGASTPVLPMAFSAAVSSGRTATFMDSSVTARARSTAMRDSEEVVAAAIRKRAIH